MPDLALVHLGIRVEGLGFRFACLILLLYISGSRISKAAASPFSGSCKAQYIYGFRVSGFGVSIVAGNQQRCIWIYVS